MCQESLERKRSLFFISRLKKEKEKKERKKKKGEEEKRRKRRKKDKNIGFEVIVPKAREKDRGVPPPPSPHRLSGGSLF